MSCRRGASGRTRQRAAGLFAALVALILLGRPVAAADAMVTRIAMLPLSQRTTIVVELSSPVSQVAEVQADSTTVVVEAGPIAAGVQARDLTPVGPAPIISGVHLSSTVHGDGTNYLRLRVTTNTPAAHHHRTMRSRVYVDFAALAAPDGRSVNLAEPTPPPRALPPNAPRDTAAPPRELASESEPQPVDPDVLTEAAYQALESSTLRRARDLAARPDVKGLLRLREEAQRRDDALGHQRDELMSRLMAEVLRYTDEARTLQLERDRRTFLKKE